MTGSLFLILLQVTVVALGLSGGVAGRADFRMLYSGGFLIRNGQGDQLYEYDKIAATEARIAGQSGANLPFDHPAYEGLLFAAFAVVDYKKAYWLHFCLNLALLFVAIRILTADAKLDE